MNGLVQDLRYALRQLRKSPGFTAVAVLTLALGIGATVAVFSVMNAVLLNPSGIPHAENVVALREKYGFGDLSNIPVSSPDFADAVAGKNTFTSAAIMESADFNYSGSNTTPEKLTGAKVSWQWFDVFWARPYLGRVFRPEEDQPGADHEVLLSYQAWQRRFGADPSIVGRSLQLNEESYRVVGVMGPDFAWPNEAELWTPIGLPANDYFDSKLRHNEYLFAVARLRPGVTVAMANSYLNMCVARAIAAEGAQSASQAAGWGMFAMPLVDYVAGSLRQPLFILLAAVATILLIICANIAGLQLARASGKQREVSVQIALGASQARLARQSLAEGVCLSVAGAILGFAMAKALVPLLLLLAPASLMLNIAVHMDKAVLLFILAMAGLCTLLCGLAPSWRLSHASWFQTLQEGGRSDGTSRGRQRLRSGLVIAQIAMAMVLLLAAGLLIRSLQKLQEVQTGFDAHGLMTAQFSLPSATYKEPAQQSALFAALEPQMNAIPGVNHAAIANILPFTGGAWAGSFLIEGQTLPPNDPGPHSNIRHVSADYFSTLRIPLLRGRVFTPQDRAGTELVGVVDETLAHRYWPHQDPIGQHIRAASRISTPWITVVGVVKHAKASSLQADTTEGFYYLPIAQSPSLSAGIVVRTSTSDPAGVSDALRAAIRAVDPNLPLYDLKTMDERVDASLTGQKFLVVLLSIFAGLALLLSALGLYGIISYTVRLRKRELGVRVALGANRHDVLRMILGQGMRLVVAGLVVGVTVTFVLGRVLGNLLYQVSLFNPLTLFVVSGVLAATALLAGYIPARRAARVDPMVALRYE